MGLVEPDVVPEDRRSMKLTLRVTLTTTLVTLIVVTVVALGYNAHRNARFTATDLSSQILEQDARLVEARVDTLLEIANRQGNLNVELLRDKQFDTETFHRLARYWISVLKTHPRISRQSLALSQTGEWSFVRRLPNGKIAIGELRRGGPGGSLVLKDYWPEGYPETSFNQIDQADGDDPRLQDWYKIAAKAGRQVWSKVYLFDDVEGFDHLPGLSCSTPLFGDDGQLRAVLTSSFDVLSLSDYLRSFKVGKNGLAFVAEVRENGKLQVIAHPDHKILIRKAGSDGRDRLNELVPSDELSDKRVGAFLKEVPTTLDPANANQTIQIRVVHDGVPYLGAYHTLANRQNPEWVICLMMPENDVMGRVEASNRETYYVGLGILVVAILLGLYVSAQVARPLERVVQQTQKIGQFEVEARPVAHSMILEVDHLANAVEETKTSLRSFGKYVPTDVIRTMFATGREAELGGDRRRITISFCDLANFTTLAEKLPPEELVLQMGDYFGRFSADIVAHGGTVDKYIGDAIMAIWGAPAPQPDHAVAACVTALRHKQTLLELQAKWRLEGNPELTARVGIMSGEAVVGNIGSPARLNYTAMGDAVNLASRLEGLGKYYGTSILIGESTYLEASQVVLARPVDWVSVKGKTEGMLIYELLALKDQAGPELLERVSLAEQALELYRTREWEEAIICFEAIDALHPGDGPSKVLAQRCREFLESPPPTGWDGIHRMVNK
jgi:adenylate cyclase